MALRLGNQAGVSGLILGNQENFTPQTDVFGTGAAVAQPAEVSGDGFRTSVDLGTPPDFFAEVSSVVGVGEVTHIGSGAMQAQSSTVVGSGLPIENIVGTGVLQAGASAAVGGGFIGIGGNGVLQAQESIVVGVGGLAGIVFGAGALLAQDITVAGVGERRVLGAGNLSTGVASAFGLGIVINIASDYVSWLKPNTIEIETLSFSVDYPEIFARNRNIPTSVTVGWDDLVTYHEGKRKHTRVAYKFSRDKDFIEDDE